LQLGKAIGGREECLRILIQDESVSRTRFAQLSRRNPHFAAFFIAPRRTGVRFSATNKVRGQEKVSVVLIDDQETVLRALEVARAILGECIAGQRDAARTVERLVATLNKSEVIQALDRMNRRRILRRVDFGDGPPA